MNSIHIRIRQVARRVLPILCALLVCTALWAELQQAALAEKVIRLHVVANSDDQADQAQKLQVRDRILADTRDLLTGQESAQEAAEILRENLWPLSRGASQAVAQAGYSYSVRVSLEDAWFPTRQYEGGALPAGTYQALRVVIGEGDGKNWWCVVFPSLCLPAVSETALQASGFSTQDCALITEDSPAYTFQFKTLEWWDACKGWLTGRNTD